jgi:hypothetical protein
MKKYTPVLQGILWLTPIIVGASILTIHLYRHGPPKGLVDDLLRCASKSDERLECGTKEIANLLKDHTGEEIMEAIEGRLSSTACHTVGHVIGQQEYRKFKSVELAIRDCGYRCFSSCTHGILGEALIEHAGVDISEDGIHFNPKQVEKYGKDLCTNPDSCHGVGHVLFQLYNELESAAGVCSAISSGVKREYCFEGVFMENASSITTVGLQKDFKKNQARRTGDLLYPCSETLPEYRNACFFHLPLLQATIFTEMGITDAKQKTYLRRKACESLIDIHDQSSCFEGFGYALRNAEGDSSVMRTECTSLASEYNRAACVYGVAYSFAVYFRSRDAINFCGTIPGSYERSLCFHGTFSLTNFWDTISRNFSKDERDAELRRLCDHNSALRIICNEELTQYILDPWSTAFGLIRSE